MNGIPLKILIIDPDLASADALANVLRDIDIVLSIDQRASLAEASVELKMSEINAIYIDPIGLGIKKASDFIFDVRKRNSTIIFVLYIDSKKQKEQANQLYSGSRRRWRHYFKLNKNTPLADFPRRVQDTVSACQGDLAANLTQEKITSLQQELLNIQKGASDDNVVVPVRILKDIQDQLAAREKETKTPGSIGRPAQFLGPNASSVVAKRCFVIMPYSQPWSEGVEAIIRESCEALGFEFVIAKTMEGRFVPHDIWEGITGAGIMIADLTGANANVAYEIGLADAIGRNVILICQDTKVPFDFLGQRLIVYENSVSGALTLRQELNDRLNRIRQRLENDTTKNDSEVGDAHRA